MRSIHTHAHTYLKIVPNTLLYKTFQICSFLSVMYFALFHFMIDCSLTNHWLLMYLNFQVESIWVWKRKVSGIILFFFFCIEPGLATRFIHDIIHVSMLFSQISPPSPSPTESIRLIYASVSLLLSRTQGYCYHLSKFHIYVLVYCIGVFLSGLLHSI